MSRAELRSQRKLENFLDQRNPLTKRFKCLLELIGLLSLNICFSASLCVALRFACFSGSLIAPSVCLN